MKERSRAPQSCPHKTPREIEELIVAERIATGFGSKKIRRRLEDADPERELPSRAAMDGILKRHGLVKKRRKRKRGKTPFARRYSAREPGELMSLDFKGEFKLGNGQYCYPLTVMDWKSRYVLGCEALGSTRFAGAWPVVTRIFREQGLPKAVLSDNGPPFGPTGLARLSTMSVHLMQLDVQPVFIRPGRPDENGRHERMHLELKNWATIPPESSLRAQQKRLDAFRKMYNEERPHESLEMDRPADHYRKSPRTYPNKILAPEYPSHFETRLVSRGGTFKWSNGAIFIGTPLSHQRIGFEPTGDAMWAVYYYDFLIANFDERNKDIF